MPERLFDPEAADREADELERYAYFDAAERRTEYLCTDLEGARMLVRTEDKHIGRAIFAKQRRGDSKVLQRCVKAVTGLLGDDAIAGRTLIDVGANIGTTTVPALLTLPFAKVVALEPEPENFLTLRLNVVLNELDDRVLPLQMAASNVVGELTLMVDRSRSGKHWIATGDNSAATIRDSVALTVPVVTLDSLAGDAFELDDVGFLWIDAEHHEGQILEGASSLLRNGVPLAFEWDRKGLEGDATTKILEATSEHYTHFSDMRAIKDGSAPKYQLRPVAELGDYARIKQGVREHFTEILVLRLDERQRDLDLVSILSDDAPAAKRGFLSRRRR